MKSTHKDRCTKVCGFLKGFTDVSPTRNKVPPKVSCLRGTVRCCSEIYACIQLGPRCVRASPRSQPPGFPAALHARSWLAALSSAALTS